MTSDRLPIRYRPACDCDLPDMVGMNGLLPKENRFPLPVLAYINNQRTCRTFVADAKGIVGVVIAHKLRGPSGEIVFFDFDPECLKSEIPSALVERAEAWLRREGARTVFVEAEPDSGHSRVCRELGYTVHDELESGDGRRLLMGKTF